MATDLNDSGDVSELSSLIDDGTTDAAYATITGGTGFIYNGTTIVGNPFDGRMYIYQGAQNNYDLVHRKPH